MNTTEVNMPGGTAKATSQQQRIHSYLQSTLFCTHYVSLVKLSECTCYE